MKDDPSNGAGKPAARAQLALEIVTRRVADTFAAKDASQSEQTRRGLLALAGRLTSHLAIIFVSFVAIALASLRLGSNGAATVDLDGGQAGSLGVGRSPTNLTSADRSGKTLNGFQQAGFSSGDGSIIVRDPGMDIAQQLKAASAGAEAAPGAVSPGANASAPARNQIETYRVQPGDAISTIAERYGLSPNTIAWANPAVENNPELLKIGQELTILPVDGVFYTVKNGDTLGGIAQRFRAEANEIQTYPLNGLGTDVLTVGSQIVIPNGTKLTARASAPAPVARRAAANPSGVQVAAGGATGNFLWPTRGVITQNYWAYHQALDIANNNGTPIFASDGGYVSYAGWSPVGYGYMVKVSHNNGFETLYGHLSYYDVEPGMYVAQGSIIGRMGSTGNSTGPHLHFEIRYGGTLQNPNLYLAY